MKKGYELLVMSCDKERTATPLELFFDLVIVVALGSISTMFARDNFWNLLFGSIIFTWMSITFYGLYFWSEKGSYLVRTIIVIMMIPIILISSLTSITTLKSLIIANFCLMLIEMIKIFLWYETVFKNKKIDNNLEELIELDEEISTKYSGFTKCS